MRVVLLALFSLALAGVVCSPGYTCAESSGVVWVLKDDGNVNGPSCAGTCEAALGQSSTFHACALSQDTFANASQFEPISTLLGFDCRPGGCWDSVAPGSGLLLVSRDTQSGTPRPTRTCYFPTESKFSCQNNPGNANCFNERYSSICPCVSKPLEEACVWDCPNFPLVAKFPSSAAQETDGTCLNRINYWRKRACDENWFECPSSGLPPMTECVGCNSCANSQARFDRENGSHKSFKRCGELVQGVSGGANCAAAIDGFVAERALDSSDGIMKCQGHCGPM